MKLRPLKFINKKISRKFSFAVVLTILSVMVIFMALEIQTSILNEQKMLEDKMTTLTDITKNALSQALWNFDDKGEKIIADSLMKDDAIAGMKIYNDEDIPIYSHFKEGTAYHSVYLIRQHNAIQYEGKLIGYIELQFTTYYMSHNIQVVIYRRLFQIGILMLAMVITVLYISIRITRPIEHLSRETALIASGDLNRRINVTNQDEIGILAEKFNEMVAALAQARESIAKDAIELEQKNREILIYSEELEVLVNARTSDYNHANSELKLKNEELEHTLTIFHETQDQLIETKKMAALGTLVAGVAHEINTPLGNGITMASFLQKIHGDLHYKLQNGSLSRQDLLTFLDDFKDSAIILSTNLDRSANLVQHFKQLAVDLSTDEKTTFSLHENIETVIISLKHEYSGTKHQLENLCSKGLMLTSYPGEFSQIFTHLIKNSLEHGLKDQPQGLIQISANLSDDDLLRIDYTDNGIGISEDNLTKIFDPFYTTSRYHGNAGIGLNIIYNIVTHKLHGNIHCESRPGAGVKFVIFLPMEQTT